jgi:hypothetical protein
MSRNHKSKINYLQTLNSISSGSVKYLIRPDYYIQIKETNWYYINVYTTITGYLAVA